MLMSFGRAACEKPFASCLLRTSCYKVDLARLMVERRRTETFATAIQLVSNGFILTKPRDTEIENSREKGGRDERTMKYWDGRDSVPYT